MMVKQAVDARESTWKWVHLLIPVVDGELGKLVLAKARGYHETNDRKGFWCWLSSVPRYDQQSVQYIHELNRYG